MSSDLAKRIAQRVWETASGANRDDVSRIVDDFIAPLLAVVEAADEIHAKWDELGLLPGSPQCQKLVQALVAYRATQQPPTTNRGCDRCSGRGIMLDDTFKPYLCGCVRKQIESQKE